MEKSGFFFIIFPVQCTMYCMALYDTQCTAVANGIVSLFCGVAVVKQESCVFFIINKNKKNICCSMVLWNIVFQMMLPY